MSDGCEDRDNYGQFTRIYLSKLSIYLKNYVKNGLIFKTTTQNKFFSSTKKRGRQTEKEKENYSEREIERGIGIIFNKAFNVTSALI